MATQEYRRDGCEIYVADREEFINSRLGMICSSAAQGIPARIPIARSDVRLNTGTESRARRQIKMSEERS